MGLSELREAVANLPDDAEVVIQDQYGHKYALDKAYAYGVGQAQQGEPGLMLRITSMPR